MRTDVESSGRASVPNTDARWIRRAVVAIAGGYLALGLFSSIWISQAWFDDPFTFGRGQLWNALDPGALYVSDTVLFFSGEPIEHFSHPGLTMTFLSGTMARIIASLLGHAGADYLPHVVRHHRAYFAAFSFLSCLAFVACCQPLFRIARRFHSEGFAWAACGLWLTSTPVVLFVNRFSPEPTMLLFGLWSVERSLDALTHPVTTRACVVLGGASALSILAKPLMAPIVLLGAYAVVASPVPPNDGRKTIPLRLACWGGAIVILCALAAVKLPVADFLTIRASLFAEGAHSQSLGELFRSHHEAPLLGAHAVLATLAIGGIVIRLKTAPEKRRIDAVLIGLLLAMLAMIARRPYWQYYFGFYWILELFALGFVVWLVSRLRRSADDRSAALAGALTLAVVWGAWAPGLYSPFKQYHDRWSERSAQHARDPLGGPAIWETRVGDADLSEIWDVQSARLQRVLMDLRSARPGAPPSARSD